MTWSIIGSGFVGTLLSKQHKNSQVYNRYNIDQLYKKSHDTVIIAAPTGNRLTVNRFPEQDFDNCKKIAQAIEQTSFKNLVYISTVDVFHNSSYGQNRSWLEQQVKKHNNHSVVRLPSLCDPTVKKNIIYDLATSKWLENISLESEIQWYPTHRLRQDLEFIINQKIQDINLVSCPLKNKELVTRCAPELIDRLSHNQVTPMKYNTLSLNNQYWIDTDSIWYEIENTFKIIKANVEQ